MLVCPAAVLRGRDGMGEQGECLTAVYEVQGPEANARSLAQSGFPT
jgi:hypothetical protein